MHIVSPIEALPTKKPEPLTYLSIRQTPIVDSDGIPLSSDREHPELIEGIDWQYGACPYKNSPSRNPLGIPHKVPMSFLERDRLVRAYPDMLQIIDDVRKLFIEEADMPEELAVYEVRSLLKALRATPHYLVFRGSNSYSPSGGLPPSLLALSNSASGALGATGTILDKGMRTGNFEAVLRVPDVDETIRYSEDIGSLVGKKTVCAASPAMMKSFIEAAVYGVKKSEHSNSQVSRNKLNIWEYISKEEIINLFMFANSMEFCGDAAEVLRKVDEESVIKVTQHIAKKHSERNIRQTVADYFAKVDVIMRALVAHQVAINGALGRVPQVLETSLKDFEDFKNLKMLEVIDGLTESQIPRDLLTGEQKRTHVAVDLGSSILRLLAEADGMSIPFYVR